MLELVFANLLLSIDILSSILLFIVFNEKTNLRNNIKTKKYKNVITKKQFRLEFCIYIVLIDGSKFLINIYYSACVLHMELTIG